MNATSEMQHLTDADLIRHLDDEGGADERARRADHLDRCEPCAARSRAFRGHSDTVTAWLERADAEVGDGTRAFARREPRRSALRRARPWLQAAAVVLLLGAPLAASPALRGWVAGRLGLEPAPQTEATPPSARAADARAGTLIRFAPAAGVFTVRALDLEAGTGGAFLEVGRAAGDEAVLRGAAGPVVSESSLVLRADAGGGGATYALMLPRGVTALRIIAGDRVITVTGADLDDGRMIRLNR